ncbi:YqcC family protein [Pseudomonadales bacterium]|nr:YqcC family protein [Pseudomonadales bacterium]MDB4090383.1 YqcC family protein [Pseudomonadales bacterium]
MHNIHTALAAALQDIQAEMVSLQLWELERPSEAALASTEPFCIDTLNFAQWLQFIFLEKMRAIIEHGGPLPSQSDIAPLAEEYLSQKKAKGTKLIERLKYTDDLISGRIQAKAITARLSS